MQKKVVVVGAGAAGLMAAGRAAERGCDVVVFEKKSQPGKKILISGKGRCNITNTTDMEGLIENTPANGFFLYSTFYTFSNYDIIKFFNDFGVATKVERGGRVFPESDNAGDVLKALLEYARKNKARLVYNSRVTGIIAKDGRIEGVMVNNKDFYECDAVILAAGGASYPGTGSTGDGYRIAAGLGHAISDLKPSLVPLVAQEDWVRELQGLSLKNVLLKAYDQKRKKIFEDFGEMLFTHFGVSGPLVLSASSHMVSCGFKGCFISIDLKPALDEQTLDARIQRDFEKYSRKQFKNSLDDLLPQKMIPVIVKLSGINESKPVNQITRSERQLLVKLLKNMIINIEDARPIAEAIVTSGGVNVDEINPSTMESKLVKGLYFAGEVIDVDAYTGGFNLTIAFSTGYTAGNSV